MPGLVIAVYSAKGGVGKTTLAVNLAWASAELSCRRTLLWDLDPQGGASFILRQQSAGSAVRSGIVGKQDLHDVIGRTGFDRLHVLAADRSLRHLDRDFHELEKPKRLSRVAASLAADYDRIIIDCPPGLGETSDQILRAVDLVVVPVIPATLSQRALDIVKDHLQRRKRHGVALAPVFSMVDRRRQQHRQALTEHPTWPVIPMASAFERVSHERSPIGALLTRKSPPVEAVALLWRRIEKELASG